MKKYQDKMTLYQKGMFFEYVLINIAFVFNNFK